MSWTPRIGPDCDGESGGGGGSACRSLRCIIFVHVRSVASDTVQAGSSSPRSPIPYHVRSNGKSSTRCRCSRVTVVDAIHPNESACPRTRRQPGRNERNARVKTSNFSCPCCVASSPPGHLEARIRDRTRTSSATPRAKERGVVWPLHSRDEHTCPPACPLALPHPPYGYALPSFSQFFVDRTSIFPTPKLHAKHRTRYVSRSPTAHRSLSYMLRLLLSRPKRHEGGRHHPNQLRIRPHPLGPCGSNLKAFCVTQSPTQTTITSQAA